MFVADSPPTGCHDKSCRCGGKVESKPIESEDESDSPPPEIVLVLQPVTYRCLIKPMVFNYNSGRLREVKILY